jgi:hypothetical protein
MAIEGDSAEYEFLAEAVELMKDVQGICCEIGVRRGMGTKTILDAVKQYCPEKYVVSVDPYGNIPYTGREPDGETHYDYTDDMMNDCMADMWAYVRDNRMKWKFFNLTDRDFFKSFWEGVPVYEYFGAGKATTYSMIHYDGPHTVLDLKAETAFFNLRTPVGGVWVFDDCTPDFYDHSIIDEWVKDMGFELVKIGNKKAVYRRSRC